MKKTALVTTALIGALLTPLRSDAQIATTITVQSWYANTNNGGGAWNATSTVGLGAPTFKNLVVYCFDDKRFFQFNTPTQYLALTFSQFVNNVGAGAGGRGANWNSVTLPDLNAMVDLASQYRTLNNNTNRTFNSNLQQDIWDIGNNVDPGASLNDFSQNWMVLVDQAEWERGLSGQMVNGKLTFRGSQSFLVQVPQAFQVPEPTSLALVVVGLTLTGLRARRRNN